MIEIELPNNPVPWSASRISDRGAFNPRGKEKKFTRWQIKSMYRDAPIQGYVVLDLLFICPIPNSTSKKKRAEMLAGDIIPTHLDTTNCQKFIEDCLKDIVFQDDRFSSKIISEKLYGEKGKILIKVWPRDEYRKLKNENLLG